MNDLKQQIDHLSVLRYSRLHGDILSVGECICLHQWIHQDIEPNRSLVMRIIAIDKDLKKINWQFPKLFYNEHLDVCTRCTKTDKERILIKYNR